MKGTLWATALAACAPAAAADTVFHSWMVAPPVVQAGETFTVEVWLSMETTDFDPEGTFFGWATLSVEFGGDRELIERSTEAYGHVAPGLNGDVSATGISDIAPAQLGYPVHWAIDYSNPILMFRFDITLADSGGGTLDFSYGPHSLYGATHFGWYLDPETWYEGSVNTLETPNTYYQAEGVSVRIIPAPVGVVSLALGGLGLVRRRRRPVAGVCGGRRYSRYVYPSSPLS